MQIEDCYIEKVWTDERGWKCFRSGELEVCIIPSKFPKDLKSGKVIKYMNFYMDSKKVHVKMEGEK